MAPSTQKNLERFSTYGHAPFCCVCLGCCAAEFGNSGGTYELPCISCQWNADQTTAHLGFTKLCLPVQTFVTSIDQQHTCVPISNSEEQWTDSGHLALPE